MARKVTEEEVQKARDTEVHPVDVYQWWEVDEATALSTRKGSHFQDEVVEQVIAVGEPARCFVQTVRWVYPDQEVRTTPA